MPPLKKAFLPLLLISSIHSTLAQNAGEVMFVGFSADGTDGFAFVPLVDLADETVLYFSDNEWSGTAFDSDSDGGVADGIITWENTSGRVIPAGIVVTVSTLTTSASASIGTATTTSGTVNLRAVDEVLYMYRGTDATTPTTFISLVATEDYSATIGQITGTGLTDGVNAIHFTNDQDVMVYDDANEWNSSVANAAAAIATLTNWTSDNNDPNDDSDNVYPDFPDDITCNFYGSIFTGITYYSFASGAWADNNSWTIMSDGTGGPLFAGEWPRRNDNVVILSGHTITSSNEGDNEPCIGNGLSADDLNQANVGTFTGSNNELFYHTGNIVVNTGASLVLTDGAMVGGYTNINGTLTVTDDFVNVGYLEISSSATTDFDDDLILSGNSTTIINNTSTAFDDLYLDWTDAILCGEGVMNLGNGGPDPTVRFFNGATASQVCSSFDITCTSNCGGFSSGNPSGSFSFGNTGPGGVGSESSNELWLKPDDLTLNDGDPVSTWDDASGNNLSAVSNGIVAEEPTYRANSVNGLPSIDFNGNDYLNLGAPASLNFIPGTSQWSFFVVYNVPDLTQGTLFSKATNATRQYQFTIDDNAGDSYFTSFIGGTQNIGTVLATSDWFVSSHTVTTSDKDSWTNENVNFSNLGLGTAQDASAEVLIGARRDSGPTTGAGFYLIGTLGEIAVYNHVVNTAQRIIITNYLAAKYDISLLAASDLYEMDDVANGDYDYDVAGIGRAGDGSSHYDAKGSGIVRMWGASDLDNSEYLLWGHNNADLQGTTTGVDGTVIQERIERIWRVSETSEVGTVNISFDISSFDDPLGANLRLMIDRDGDGFTDNDVTPITGAALANDIVTFSGVDFEDGDRFTLGNTDLNNPLPVIVEYFKAKVEDGIVQLSWKTSFDNLIDYYTIERSPDGESWTHFSKVAAARTPELDKQYTTTDDGPFRGTSYYRLSQTDFDGTTQTLKTTSVTIDDELKTTVFPNPVSDVFTLEASFRLSPSGIFVQDVTGRQIPIKVMVSNQENTAVIEMIGAPAGIYILTCKDKLIAKQVRLIKEK